MKAKEKLIATYPLPWDKDQVMAFRTTLLSWYDAHKRQLPWRDIDDPYRIWVSEIMLQQTQVETVKPYYEHFIEVLPTVQALAEAEPSTLLSLWQGLGYYSRVRNMQVAARQIMTDFNGVMPDNFQGLLSLKGIGPYTAGAIASMAFQRVEPAMDGNLIRIITRLFDLDTDISRQTGLDQIRAYLYQLIDSDRPGDFNQALMDMGAQIMTASQPYPENHPLAAFDQSFRAGTAHLRPVKTKKVKNTPHYYLAYAIRSADERYLLREHGDQELLTGLWHFPLVEKEVVLEEATFGEMMEGLLGTFDALNAITAFGDLHLAPGITGSGFLPEFVQIKHVFSHRTWYIQLIPLVWEGQSQNPTLSDEFVWISLEQSHQTPYSTLQRKLWEALLPLERRK